MSQLTPHLGLKKPDGSDPFLRQDFDDNYDLLDTSPGIYICTSATHPTTWGDGQVGRGIIETDTGAILYFRSDHTFQASLAAGSTDVATLSAEVTSLSSQLGTVQSNLGTTPNVQLSQHQANTTLAAGATVNFDVFGGSQPQMTFDAGGVIVVLGFVGLSAPGDASRANHVTYDVTIDGTAANWGDPAEFQHYQLASVTASGTWFVDIPYLCIRDIGSAGSHTMRIAVTNHDSGGSASTVTHVKALALLGHHNT